MDFPLITPDDVINIIKPIQIDSQIIHQNMHLFQSAFTHESVLEYLKTHPDPRFNNVTSYERLEFLGDAFLQWTAGLYVFTKYTNANPGFLTTSRINIVNKHSLKTYVSKLGLKKFLCVVPDEKHPHINEKLYSDLFESFLGVLVYLFSTTTIPHDFVFRVFETFVTQELLEEDCNYKSLLLKYYHAQKWDHPVYKLISQVRDDSTGTMEFTSGVLGPDGSVVAVGKSNKKVESEQSASLNALIRLEGLFN